MIKRSMDGLLFFRGGRQLHACVAYDVTPTSARIHADGLGPLPIDFYVTFDKFRTIARCRLVWRYQNRIGVAFEKWIRVRGQAVGSESDPGCGWLCAAHAAVPPQTASADGLSPSRNPSESKR